MPFQNSPWFYVLAGLCLLAIVYMKYFSHQETKEEQLPYRKKDSLLTEVEQKFFEGFQEIVPKEFVVFPQIALNSIIETTDKKEKWQFNNKINRRRLDFVIFRKSDYSPMVVIEYDDSSHLGTRQKEKDEFENKALKAAGLKILRVQHQANIDYEKLRTEMEALLQN